MQFSSIWPIDKTLSGVTTPGQSGPGSDGNEGIHSDGSSITGTSPLDCLVSFTGHSWGKELYPFAEVQSVYFTAPADRAIKLLALNSSTSKHLSGCKQMIKIK